MGAVLFQEWAHLLGSSSFPLCSQEISYLSSFLSTPIPLLPLGSTCHSSQHPPTLPQFHGTHGNSDHVHQSGSLHCISWAGHFYSLCNTLSASLLVITLFFSYRAFVISAHPQLFCLPFSPEASASLKTHGLVHIELLPRCSRFFILLPLHLVYSHPGGALVKGTFQ